MVDSQEIAGGTRFMYGSKFSKLLLCVSLACLVVFSVPKPAQAGAEGRALTYGLIASAIGGAALYRTFRNQRKFERHVDSGYPYYGSRRRSYHSRPVSSRRCYYDDCGYGYSSAYQPSSYYYRYEEAAYPRRTSYYRNAGYGSYYGRRSRGYGGYYGSRGYGGYYGNRYYY